MIRRSLRHGLTAVMLLVAMSSQVTWALAGTTGGLTGVVVDADTSAPVAGATVTASAPSQSATTTTDAGGHFTFLTLAPDTYTVTVDKSGYSSASEPGQIVFADTDQSVAIRLTKALKTIAHVTSTGAGALVKSGTTADIYSVNTTTQQAVAALGGGGSLNQAYSAIATMPGAYVVPNQTGYFETVNIRGGDYDQVGYEFDGVPVLRSFDNYGSSSANSLGSAEVEVYTGATPANSESAGLAGFINQVIKTGTYPGYAQASLGIGTPQYYHRAAVEAGGATPDRLFSYYVGIGGANQSYDYVNTTNAWEYNPNFGIAQNLVGFSPGCASKNLPASLVAECAGNGNYAPQCLGGGSLGCFGPNQLAMGPINYGAFSSIYSRDNVVNFHFGIPHHHDSGRDDIQVLYDNESLQNQLYESPSDFASPQCGPLGGTACATFLYGPQLQPNVPTWNGSCGAQIGHAVSASSPACVTNYTVPHQDNAGSFTAPNAIPANVRDSTYNQTVIAKLQYTKNFSSSAFLRVYGYTFYSTWMLAGVLGDADCNFSCTASPDYELSTHTRGLSANFQDQLNSENLVSLQGSYTVASIVRDNNHFYAVPNEPFAEIVNANDPYIGYCFGGTFAAATTKGTFNPVDCHSAGYAGATTANPNTTWGYQTIGGVQAGLPSVAGFKCAIPGKPQFGSACEYMIAENGLNGDITPGLIPSFYGWSLSDQFRPSDKWLIVPGVRLDTFNFAGGNQVVPPLGPQGGQVAAVRQFWWNAFNLDNCQNTTTGAVFPNPAPGKVCPKGSISTYMQNATNQNFTFNIWQPRLSGTYTVNPDNVVRFSAGRYTEAGNTAFEQYGTRQEDSADFIGPSLLQYGRNTPGYPVQPQTSLNYDMSWESHLKGTDWSFKLTPFLRQTQNQIQEFFLNAKEGFVSGLNAGNQRSEGVEVQVQKGDFSRNGISGLLSFAYTNTYITYGAVNAYGASPLAAVNNGIQNYNAYTSYCVAHPSNNAMNPCYTGSGGVSNTTNNLVAARCYTAAGLPDPTCKAGDIANPYWNATPQPILSPTGQYPTYDLFPTTAELGSYSGFNAPYVSSLVLNYKHDKFAITPSFQFQGGTRYGYPLAQTGIDPTGGYSALGGVYGNRYNAASATGVLAIPDPFTGHFDNLGQFLQPNEFMMNLQVSYQVSPAIQIVGTMANIVNYCFGGTPQAWTLNDGNVCAYQTPNSLLDSVAPLGTPGAAINPAGAGKGAYLIQREEQYPYVPNFGPNLASALNSSTKTPFQFFVTANIKI